jgi:hypothetical protein
MGDLMNDFQGQTGQTLDPTHTPPVAQPVEHNTYHLGEIINSLIGPQSTSGVEPDADNMGGPSDNDADNVPSLMPGTDGVPSDEDAPEPMTEDDLKALLAAKIQSSHQWYGTGKLSSKRIDADKFYRGEPLGNEQDGRSQVISRDVAEAVDSIMPSLMRVFAGGDRVVVFEPQGPEDEDAANQATDYINHIFMEENEGFLVFNTWFKDALLKKNGVVKVWYDIRLNRTKDNYEGLDQGQLQALQMDPSITVSNVQAYQDQIIVTDPATGQPVPHPVQLFNCTVISSKPEKRVKVTNVPPDEFIIERRATGLDAVGFLAHRSKRTIDDLLTSGYQADLVKSIPASDDRDFSQERIERFGDEDQLPYGSEGDILNELMRKVWITEAYIKVDFDGDGFAEWRKVVTASESGEAGSIILSNEEVDNHPFCTLTPIPEPHKFFGQSLFDQTKDIQEVKTAVLRGALDSIYLANAPRYGAVEGQVNFDDLLDARPGGIVRLKNPAGLVPMPTVGVAPQAFQVIEYMDSVRESRTGITRYNQGLNADSLNKTATGIQIINNAGVQRQEMIARVFAETGVKDLFRKIFKLTCQYEDKPRVVRLRGRWVNINPRDWKDHMDVVTTVGIGMGDKQQQAQIAMQMLNLSKEIFQLQGGPNGPLLDLKNVYNMLTKLVEAVGWKNVEPYFTDPATAQPQPPPPPKPDQQKDMVALEMKKYDLEMKKLELEVKKLEAMTVIGPIAGTFLPPDVQNGLNSGPPASFSPPGGGMQGPGPQNSPAVPPNGSAGMVNMPPNMVNKPQPDTFMQGG